ncbi:PhoX family phosphatase [Hyphomicrobium sp.]|uniref:PhoX family protein n=1 Tax=Hyphomicrobium sp. TaxID=82 RepID=UPI002BC9D294|nr:PhoX family phosphatase [Hyphomicrobium sp.]HRN87052.1 PhoX family phosphatase [Hyphomicrobium sp.]HRQ26370.1 PhoX family phosphatase [Hyphomicrobium sp.]
MRNRKLQPSVAFEAAENAGSNPTTAPTMGDLIAERLSRRDLIQGLAAVSVAAELAWPRALAAAPAESKARDAASSFGFAELTVSPGSPTHHVAEGYEAHVLIRWGDPVLPDAPPFVPNRADAAAQARQFGYNNDFVGFLPLDGRDDHGLLVVNHEYTNGELMFSGLATRGDRDANFASLTREMVDTEMMAHGGAVIEVRRENGRWHVVPASNYARRITAETEMVLSGPAAGHDRMKTSDDPTGTRVRGMLNNCAGGLTPWDTWLTCEENINGYFWNKAAAEPLTAEARALRRYGAPAEWYAWGRFHDRFDVTKEPNEPNRFGWVVEIDPFDPTSTPIKRTALGRFKHEGAGNIVNRDSRFVVYQGDDEAFDYVYRFVTDGKVDPTNKDANRNLLDNGVLSVARFHADGTGEWLPLVHGRPNKDGQVWLTEANGFQDQGDVLIHTRLAADLLGPTKMDRPEDIDVNPTTGKVYLALTGNLKRTEERMDAANPRAANAFGHIIEIAPDGSDHAADTFTWDILIKCGSPQIAEVGATFNPATSDNGWFGMPDNFAVDADGRLWVTTDGNSPRKTNRADGVWSIETEGPERGTSRCFFQVPVGAEMCGPCFTPDLETFFVAVQHPGETEIGGDVISTFDSPTTRWPDFENGTPPRPAIVAITRKGGGKIGG